jgi:hypothetical protein
VIAGLHTGKLGAQGKRLVRVALQVEAARRIIVAGEGKHLTHHFENEGIGPKGPLLGRTRFGEAVIPDGLQVEHGKDHFTRRESVMRHKFGL